MYANKEKKGSVFLYLLLFIISIVLLVVTGPLGFVFGVFYSLFKKGIPGLGNYLLEIAVSIDQLGNVQMQYLLNVLWLKKGAYPFGNRDETISSALGRNKKLGTLSKIGLIIDRFLDFLDPNHSLNSIDQYIEPSKDILEVVVWIYIQDYRILCTRSRDKQVYFIPGGKKERDENKIVALRREIKEELNVRLIENSIKKVGVFEGPAEGYPSGKLVRLHCFKATFEGELLPSSEIEELVWLSYQDIQMLAPVDRQIFDFLKKKKYLR
ncbi:NUDIX hydrolase [Eudoraea chungangensis]|uniref:NUDIX hydrolase n=1 Tax=Eudoraea chungangensis TaxID=1481905 RepID=UPI0023ECCF52|nr:NUDIX domain-containing protein [Eudoraea chungangensis]